MINAAAKESFTASYMARRESINSQKFKISLESDAALRYYFESHMNVIEGWFDIIAPAGKQLAVLKDELDTLKRKNWQEIHS